MCERVCVCVRAHARERERERENRQHTGVTVGGPGPCSLCFSVLPPDIPPTPTLAARGHHGVWPAHARALPRTAGWTRSQLPRHVPFLFRPSAGPPQGPISTAVLWKVSAPGSTLWPDVVIRNSYKKRQNTGRKGEGSGPRSSCRERVIPGSSCRPKAAPRSRHHFLFRTA